MLAMLTRSLLPRTPAENLQTKRSRTLTFKKHISQPKRLTQRPGHWQEHQPQDETTNPN